jgi:tetratricopeptide (TPR) repeat protein
MERKPYADLRRALERLPETTWREAAELATRVYGNDSVDALAVRLEVGNLLAAEQRFPQAIAELQPLLDRWRALQAPQDDRYVAALAALANATDTIGDKPVSEARFRELLELKRRIYKAPHDAIARTLRDLAVVEMRAEKYAEAEKLVDEALTMQRAVFGEDHVEVADSYDTLGEIEVAQRKFDAADVAYGKAIAICGRAALRDEVCPRSHNNYGMALYRRDRLDEAKAEMTEALAERRALFGDDHPTVAYSLSTLANVASKQGDYAGAVAASKQALEVLERAGMATSREDALIRNGYAQALWQDKHADAALAEIRRAVADWQRVAPEGKVRRVMMLVLEAKILRDLDRAAEARAAVDAALATGADPHELADRTKKLLSELSGRDDLFPAATSN